MATINPVSFTDYGAEQADIERRRQMAMALQQQSMEPLQGGMSGGWAVPINPLQGMAKLLQGYVGAKGQQSATERQIALAARLRGDTADALHNYQQSGDISHLLGNPILAPAAVGAVTKQMEPHVLGPNSILAGPGGSILASNKTPDFVPVQTTGPDGQPVTRFVDKKNPPQESLPVPVRNQYIDTGQQQVPVNPYAPPAPIQKVATPGEVLSANTAEVGHNITIRGQNMTDARMREMNGILENGQPADMSALAKEIAAGNMPGPNPNALRSPLAMQRVSSLIQQVKAINPQWSQDTYPTTLATEKAYAGGGKAGQQMMSINKVVDHVTTLRELTNKWNANDLPAFNRVAAAFARQSGLPEPTNLDTAIGIVGGEIVKSIVGAGGTGEDRSKAQGALNTIIASPRQATGALNTIETLMAGQLKGLEQGYVAGTSGRTDFRSKYLTPEARTAMERYAPQVNRNSVFDAADAIIGGKK